MKTIFYVRHGESESNVSGIMSGGADDINLTKNGIEQAKRAGKDLIGKNIDLIVSSPLIRTVETATYIAQEIGYDPKNIVTNPLFVERTYGIYEGGPNTIFKEHVAKGQMHKSVESEEAMYLRLKKALNWLNTLDGRNIILVSHGAAGRAIRVIAENLHHSHMYKLDGFANTEIYEFTLK
jgi:broad specificity phosphatase PhoE